MPKPSLFGDQALLENEIIKTLEAGLHQWRPDLNYPASYSDMQGCVRALLVMFDVKRRPLPEPLAAPCPACKGTGEWRQDAFNIKTCPECRHGKIYY
jgi:hypothetical protein